MYIAEIQLTHPDLVLAPTTRAVPEMTIELENQIISDADTIYLFFTVSGGDFAEFEDAIADDPTVAGSTVIIDGDDFRVYRMRLVATDYLVLPRAAELGMRILHSKGIEGGWEAKLEVPNHDALARFRSDCTERGVTFSVIRLYQAEAERKGREFGLTAAQRDILLTAYRSGYFDEPREASLQDVADRLDISQTAASGRLRRAMTALIASTVASEAEPETSG